MNENQPQRHKDTKARFFEPIPSEIEQIAKQVVDGAFKVHSALGPGLLESVYRVCLVFEAQLLSYLKLTDRRLGLLINFNVPLIKDGINRVIR